MPTEFCHFELYYLIWHEKFNKPSDPLVLFVHWCMIQNRFKCIHDSELTDQLPPNWNSSNEYYDLHYKKHDINYRLEIYLTDDILLIQLRNLSNFMDSTQYVKIVDFINKENIKNKNFKIVFKDMEQLYQSIKWSIDHFRIKKSSQLITKFCLPNGAANTESSNSTEKTASKDTSTNLTTTTQDSPNSMETETIEIPTTSASSVSSSSAISSNSKRKSKDPKKKLSLICDLLTSNLLNKPSNLSLTDEKKKKSKDSLSYNEIINQIKAEKQEFDLNVEMYRRNSTSSTKSSTNLTNSSSNSNLIEIPTNNARKKGYAAKNKGSLSKNKKDSDVVNNQIVSENKQPDSETIMTSDDANSTEAMIVNNNPEPIPTTENLNEPGVTNSAAQASNVDNSKINNNKQVINGRFNKEKDKINRTDLYDFNPITNYFLYNRKTENKKIDQKLIEDDEFVQNAYKKFDLKFCEIKLIDCLKTDMFKGKKGPTIKLTHEMKESLNLNKPVVEHKDEFSFESDSDETDDNDDESADKTKTTLNKSLRKKRNIWRTKRRTKRNSKKTPKKSTNNKPGRKPNRESDSSALNMTSSESNTLLVGSSSSSCLPDIASNSTNPTNTNNDKELSTISENEELNKKSPNEKSAQKTKSMIEDFFTKTKLLKRKRSIEDSPLNLSDNSDLPDLGLNDYTESKAETAKSNQQVLSPITDLIKSVSDSVNSLSKENKSTVFKQLTFSSTKSSITIEPRTNNSNKKQNTNVDNTPLNTSTASSAEKDKENDDIELTETRSAKRFRSESDKCIVISSDSNDQKEDDETSLPLILASSKSPNKTQTTLLISSKLMSVTNTPSSTQTTKSPFKNTQNSNQATPKPNKFKEFTNLALESFANLVTTPKKFYSNFTSKTTSNEIEITSSNLNDSIQSPKSATKMPITPNLSEKSKTNRSISEKSNPNQIIDFTDTDKESDDDCKIIDPFNDDDDNHKKNSKNDKAKSPTANRITRSSSALKVKPELI